MTLCRSLLIALIVLAGNPAAGQTQPSPGNPEPGVSETLARERSARISNLRYDLSLTIPRDRRTAISGRETVAFALSDPSTPLAIDFNPNRSGNVLAHEQRAANVQVMRLIVVSCSHRAAERIETH